MNAQPHRLSKLGALGVCHSGNSLKAELLNVWSKPFVPTSREKMGARDSLPIVMPGVPFME